MRGCIPIHEAYLYTISDKISNGYTSIDTRESSKVVQSDASYAGAGLYVIDLTRLIDGKIDKYKLLSTVGGHSNIIENSKFSNRFTLIRNFNDIFIIPFPHMNLINCVGME